MKTGKEILGRPRCNRARVHPCASSFSTAAFRSGKRANLGEPDQYPIPGSQRNPVDRDHRSAQSSRSPRPDYRHYDIPGKASRRCLSSSRMRKLSYGSAPLDRGCTLDRDTGTLREFRHSRRRFHRLSKTRSRLCSAWRAHPLGRHRGRPEQIQHADRALHDIPRAVRVPLQISVMARDKDGVLWLGSFGSGTVEIRPQDCAIRDFGQHRQDRDAR